MGHSAFPLEWPEGQGRTTIYNRTSSKFRDLGFGKCRDDLLKALKRFGANSVTLSTEIPLRLDGLPYSNMREPSDPGVAIYFDLRSYSDVKKQWISKHYAIACDSYRKVAENMRALVHTIDAMNTIDRHGSSALREQALRGFAALPAADAKKPWWETLGMGSWDKHAGRKRTDVFTDAKVRYRELQQLHHPDRGGDVQRMQEINDAYDEAQKWSEGT